MATTHVSKFLYSKAGNFSFSVKCIFQFHDHIAQSWLFGRLLCWHAQSEL